MEANWKECIDKKKPEIVYVEGVRTTAVSTLTYRARIEVTADFDGMLGKKGFEYEVNHPIPNWTDIDGIGKFGLREDEYKYIDDGVY